MESIGTLLNYLLTEKLICTECHKSVSSEESNFHYKYCNFNKNPNEQKFTIPVGISQNLLQVCSKLLSFLSIISHKIETNELFDYNSDNYQTIDYLKIIQEFQNNIKEILRTRTLKLENINFIRDFLNIKDKKSQYQVLSKFVTNRNGLKLNKFIVDLVSSNPNIAKKYLGFNTDVRIDFRSCQYTESGQVFAISEKSKIFIFQMSDCEFLCQVSDNKSATIGLIDNFSYLIYQRLDKSVLIYNYRTFSIEAYIKHDNSDPIEYFKVSPDSTCLGIKFLSSKIIFWDIPKKKKLFSNFNIENKNFVFMHSESKVILFSTEISSFNYKSKEFSPVLFKTDKKIEFLVLLTNETLVFSDKKKMKLINLNTFETISEFSHSYQALYLTKDSKFLCDLNGNTLKIQKATVTNSITYREIVEKDNFAFFPFSHYNLYCDESLLKQPKNTVTALELILKRLKFVNDEGFMEENILTSDVLYKIVFNSSKLMVYSWDLRDCKSLEVKDWSKKVFLRFLSQDYIVLDSKMKMSFWNLKSKSTDFYYFDKDFKKVQSDILNVSRFAFFGMAKWILMPNKNDFNFKVLKRSALTPVFKSDLMPCVGRNEKEIIITQDMKLEVYDVESHVLKFSIENKSIVLNYFIVQSYLLIVFNKNVQIFDLETQKKLKKIKIKSIHTYEDLGLLTNKNLSLFKNGSQLFIQCYYKGFQSFILETGQISSIKSFQLIFDFELFFISFTIENELSSILNINIYDIKQDSTKIRIKCDLDFQPRIINKTLIYSKSSKLQLMNLVDFSIFFEVKIVENSRIKVVKERFVIILEDKKCTIIDLFNISNTKVLESKEIFEIDLTNDFKFIVATSPTGLEVFYLETMTIAYTKKIKNSDFKYFKVFDHFIVLYGKTMKFSIVRLDHELSEINKFSLPNEKIENLDFKVTKNQKYLIVSTPSSFTMIEIFGKFLMKNMTSYKVFDRNEKYIIYVDLGNEVKVINLDTLNKISLGKGYGGNVLIDFCSLEKRAIIYNKEEKYSEVKEIDFI